jgi:hypothetical protein
MMAQNSSYSSLDQNKSVKWKSNLSTKTETQEPLQKLRPIIPSQQSSSNRATKSNSPAYIAQTEIIIHIFHIFQRWLTTNQKASQRQQLLSFCGHNFFFLSAVRPIMPRKVC